MGYLTYGTDTANMLFHVVNDRHRKRRSMIFTTNKALTDWGRVFHDDDLAHAITDRVLERGRQLTLDGPSIRTRHLGLEDSLSSEASAEAARISGIQRPEFPEPTVISNAPFLGLDVRTEAIAEAMTKAEVEARALGGISNEPDALRRLVKRLGPVEHLQACFEADPTEYGVYSQLTSLGLACGVVAPVLIPIKLGDPLKTDRRDAAKLAR